MSKHILNLPQADKPSDEWQALLMLNDALKRLDLCLPMLWQWGDGQGAYVLDRLRTVVVDGGMSWPLDQKPTNQKKKSKVSRDLIRRVFERDLYRCVHCGTHLDLCCDHIFPEALGGKAVVENLQTLCRSCNSKKGVKVMSGDNNA
jgi:hypothetical protein